MSRESRENEGILPKRIEDETDLARLNHFLKTHKETRAGRGDMNFMAVRQNPNGTETIVAAARLISIESGAKPYYWVRGVFVDSDHRRHGIASHLLTHIEQTLSKNSPAVCTAFPFAHLQGFYGKLGYKACTPDALPETLKQRYQSAIEQGKDWLCMQKSIKKT